MPTCFLTVLYLDSSLDNNTQYSVTVYGNYDTWIDVVSPEDQGYVVCVDVFSPEDQGYVVCVDVFSPEDQGYVVCVDVVSPEDPRVCGVC